MKSLLIALITIPMVIVMAKTIDNALVHHTQVIYFNH